MLESASGQQPIRWPWDTSLSKRSMYVAVSYSLPTPALPALMTTGTRLLVHLAYFNCSWQSSTPLVWHTMALPTRDCQNGMWAVYTPTSADKTGLLHCLQLQQVRISTSAACLYTCQTNHEFRSGCCGLDCAVIPCGSMSYLYVQV